LWLVRPSRFPASFCEQLEQTREGNENDENQLVDVHGGESLNRYIVTSSSKSIPLFGFGSFR
jgi:hypothetical protein